MDLDKNEILANFQVGNYLDRPMFYIKIDLKFFCLSIYQCLLHKAKSLQQNNWNGQPQT